MKRKLITMIGIAAVCGAASVFAADVWLRNQANARVDPIVVAANEPAVEFGSIVVAREPLRFGRAVEREQVAEIPWAQDALPEGSFPTIDALLAEGGRMVLSPIEANEPILLAKLSGVNGRASLSNLLTPGMRAVTIRTDEVAGVGGFITPGDRVDVVLTRNAGAIQEVAGNAAGAEGSTIATEIVVADAKVLSVGQGADERDLAPQVASSVTIEVTGEGAQKVALARNIGTLSLTLRAAGEMRDEAIGLTTISAFGGSLGEGVSETGKALLEAVSAPSDEPDFKTVIVTRGMEPQSYQVLAPKE